MKLGIEYVESLIRRHMNQNEDINNIFNIDFNEETINHIKSKCMIDCGGIFCIPCEVETEKNWIIISIKNAVVSRIHINRNTKKIEYVKDIFTNPSGEKEICTRCYENENSNMFTKIYNDQFTFDIEVKDSSINIRETDVTDDGYNNYIYDLIENDIRIKEKLEVFSSNIKWKTSYIYKKDGSLDKEIREYPYGRKKEKIYNDSGFEELEYDESGKNTCSTEFISYENEEKTTIFNTAKDESESIVLDKINNIQNIRKFKNGRLYKRIIIYLPEKEEDNAIKKVLIYDGNDNLLEEKHHRFIKYKWQPIYIKNYSQNKEEFYIYEKNKIIIVKEHIDENGNRIVEKNIM